MLKIIAQNKVCIDCKIERPSKDFYRRSNNKDKLSKRCKLCETIYKAREKTKEDLCWSAICGRVNSERYQVKLRTKQAKEPKQIVIQSNKLRRFISSIFKNIILERDNYCCQLCQKTDKLELHHIIPVKQDNSPENIVNPNNLVILCQTCHLHKAHAGHYNRIDEDIKQVLLELAKNKKYLIVNKISNRVNSLFD